MATEDNDTLGVLIWSYRGWQNSSSAIVSLDLLAVGQPTAGAVYRILRAAGIHRYQFSGGGSGCRHWVISAVNLMSQSNLLPTNSVGRVVPFLSHQYSRNPHNSMPITIMRGTFLDEETWNELWADDSSDDESSEDDDEDEDEEEEDEDDDEDEAGGNEVPASNAQHAGTSDRYAITTPAYRRVQ